MQMNSVKKGFIPVMLMTYRDNGEIDYDSLANLTEFYLAAGAVGLFANCLSSEMFHLTPRERLQATQYIVKTVNGRVPVVATGNFGETIELQADFVKRIYDTGVDAVILVTGLLAAKADSEELFEANTFRLMELTGNTPLGFYECPVPYKRVLSASQLRKFLETKRLTYHKDTTLDIEQVRNKIAVSRGFNFGLYDAYLGHAVSSLKAGAAGLSCIQGNFFPEVIVWLCHNYNNPDQKEGVELVQKFLIDNMDVMHVAYPTSAKYYLQKRGLKIETFSRNYADTLSSSARQGIDGLYSDCLTLRFELSI